MDSPSLLAPLLRRWRVLTVLVILAWAIAIAITLLSPRKFEAVASLATVNTRGTLGGNLGLAASVLGTQAQGGVQATPGFVVRLARLTGVLQAVAETPVVAGKRERVIDRLMEGRAHQAPAAARYRRMQDLVSANLDPQTGLVTLRVAHQDSALARLVVRRAIEEVSRTYVRAARAQASEIRAAQALRVDSAARQLRRAEEAYADFLRGNRVVAQFSDLFVEQQRLQRAVSVSSQVYQQAITDREAAVAKELDATPAVVVVDAPPAELPTQPRMLVLRVLVATVLALTLGALVVLVGHAFSLRVRRGERAALELVDALAAVPVVGLLFARLRLPPGAPTRVA